MLSLGLALGRSQAESKQEKRGGRHALLRGLILNLVVLPVVTVGFTHALRTSGDVTAALLLLAACPGGRYMPHLVKLGGGSLSLGVELTLLLAKITVFTAPLTARWLFGLQSLEVHEVPLLLELVVLQVAPLLAGKWVSRHRPSLAARIERPVTRLALGIGAVIVAILLVKGGTRSLELLGDRGWGAVFAVAIASFLLGALFGGRDERRRRTVAISANARELALALTMASVAFPQGQVELALFAVWSTFTLLDLAYVTVIRRPSFRSADRQHA
jgi:BASS family bile acid:Na+ symporter